MSEQILGIVNILFVLALIVFALWKTGWLRLLLSVAITTWGAFMLPYDVKIAAPLITLGAVLFFMDIWGLAKQRRENRAPPQA